MKKLLALIMPLFLILTMTACGQPDSETAESSAVTAAEATTAALPETIEGGFKVDGTRLLDAKGNEFVLRGINHSHAWFKDYDDEAIEAIAATGANSVRIVLSNGIQWTADTADTVTSLINKCRENKLIAVIEVHDGTGDDSVETLEKIGEYWVGMAETLKGTEAYAILNIANEWTGKWISDVWRDGYVSVIPKLRGAGIKNTIMVDAAGWGQYGKSIAQYGREVFDSDADANTMFSIHFYGSAGKNETTITENLTGVTDQGLCVCAGEFGYKHTDGDVDEQFLMKYCTENNIGYMGWSWKGNSADVGYLDLAAVWGGSMLTKDWGEVLINGENGIKATSKICSVYE